jgi:hypothetical protein
MSSIKLPAPRSSTAEVLYGLITRSEISEQDFRMNGFRSRISDLKRMGIPVKDKTKTRPNIHGHPMTYKVRYLFSISIPKAIRLYLKINTNG